MARYWRGWGGCYRCIFPGTVYNTTSKIKLAVRGDVFVKGCSEYQSTCLAADLLTEFEISTAILGAAPHLAKATTLLNRVVGDGPTEFVGA